MAQVAPPVASGASGPASDEVIEISPFVVSTDRDVGYLAGNTLAGSRLNQSLKDTPASISVLTPEFLSDIGAFSLTEAVGYAVNVELQLDDDRPAVNGNGTVGEYQSYRVRGLPASLSRNYFRWNLPTETALLERIEDSRGPNSVLFGIGSPGGVINTSTKQPQLGRAFRRGTFTYGSYDSKRAALDLNQPLLGGKLALRLNAVYNRTNTFRHWQFEQSRRAHLGAKYVVTDKTRVRVEFEKGEVRDNQPRHANLLNSFLLWNSNGRPTYSSVPSTVEQAAAGVSQLPAAAAQPRVTYISNDNSTVAMRGTLTTTNAGPAGEGPIRDRSIADFSINVGGPAQDRFSRFSAFSAFVEHQFSKTTFLELAYNHQESGFERFDPRTGTPQALRGDPNQRLNSGVANPFAGRLYIEVGPWFRLSDRDVSDTGRATLSQEVTTEKWGRYRVAGLFEYEKRFSGTNAMQEMWVDAATGRPAFNALPENAQNAVWRRTYPTERDWATYYVSGPGPYSLLENVTDPVTGRTLSSRWVVANANQPGETYTTQKAYMLVTQARYFKGRLIVSGGLRRDDFDEYQVGTRRDPVTQQWSIARNPAEATSRLAWASFVGRNKTLGLVYHVTPKLSLFANRADNISLPARAQTRLPPNGEPGVRLPLPSPKGVGDDIGFALDLIEGRLYARATYYTTKGVDQSDTSPGPVRDANIRIMDALLASGAITQAEYDVRTELGSHGLYDRKSEGMDFQITANATKNWRFQFNYAIADAIEENKFREWVAWHQQNVQFLAGIPNAAGIVTSGGRTIAEEVDFYLTTTNGLNDATSTEGTTTLGNRRYKVSGFTRYNFSSGWLKGAFIGGGYKHQSKMFAGVDGAGNKFFGNSFWRADAMAGYRVSLRKGRSLSFQLNVLNVFDDRKPLITRYNENTGLVLREVPQAPMTWRFTTTVDF